MAAITEPSSWNRPITADVLGLREV